MNQCQHIERGPMLRVCEVCGHVAHTNAPIIRECPGRPPDRGLGDTVARFTQATGIATVVHAVSAAVGVDCGCSKRQEWLNNVVPY